MGNEGSVLQVRSDFAESPLRSVDLSSLSESVDRFERSGCSLGDRMTLEAFFECFPELSTREAVKHLKPFSERSFRPQSPLKACSLTIFTSVCLLSRAANLKEKSHFLFRLFDLGKSNRLSPDECTILLTCVLRVMGTLGEKVPRLLKSRPEMLDKLVQEPFQENRSSYLSWELFYPWSAEFVYRFLVEQVESVVSPTRRPARKNTRTSLAQRQKWDTTTNPSFDTESRVEHEMQADPKPHRPNWYRQSTQQQSERNQNQEESPRYVVDERTEMNMDNLESSQSVKDYLFEPSQYSPRRPTRSMRPPSVMLNQQENLVEEEVKSETSQDSFPEPVVKTFESQLDPLEQQGLDQLSWQREQVNAQEEAEAEEEEEEEEAEGEAEAEEEEAEEENDFLDAEQAVDQILGCLPEIDDGDLSSLPWILEALRLLGEHDDCETLRSILPHVLPLVCNVAACEDPGLASDAFGVLAVMIEGCPTEVQNCSETVNERALMEMCLVRSTDPEPLVASGATICLYRIADKQPYGFGRTLAALLEAGTLHDMPSVVVQCATTVEQIVDQMPSQITCDLEGRVNLLLSALCLWAHGELPECKQSAKVVTVKLGIRFGGQPDWEEAIQATDSPLLDVWNRGMDPSLEEERELEREHEQRKRREEAMNKLEAEQELSVDPWQMQAMERGWIVPGGFQPFPCDEDAYMYPQVFAFLGFRGPGGEAVGVAKNSSFDQWGSYRKREIITETRRVEYTKVLKNGKVQVWEEVEETVKETTHLESAQGLFAHREKFKTRQEEKVAGKLVNKETTRKEFLHFKNGLGEVSTYVEPGSPQSPQLADPIPATEDVLNEVANVAIGGSNSSSSFSRANVSTSRDKAGHEIIIEEPFSPCV